MPMPLSLLRAWVASGEVGKRAIRVAEFAGAGFVVFHGEERHAFVEAGDGDLGVVGELLEDVVVVADGVGVLAGAVVDLAEVVEGVAGEGILGVQADDLGELGGGERILGGHVVAERGLVEIGGSRGGWCGGRRWRRWA